MWFHCSHVYLWNVLAVDTAQNRPFCDETSLAIPLSVCRRLSGSLVSVWVLPIYHFIENITSRSSAWQWDLQSLWQWPTWQRKTWRIGPWLPLMSSSGSGEDMWMITSDLHRNQFTLEKKSEGKLPFPDVHLDWTLQWWIHFYHCV